MSYQALTQYSSPNYTPNAQVAAIYGIARSIDNITIHWWGDPNQNPSFEGVVAWLCNSRSQVSAHEVATGTARRSATLVNYPDAAWHTGNARGNATAIGIECDPRARNEDYDTVAEVIADIWVFYGKLPLRAHKSWFATACPGNYDLNRLNREAEIWYDRKTNKTPNATDDQIRQAYLDILERPADESGLSHYRNYAIASVRADLSTSQEKRDLDSRKAINYARNEWVRNLKPYTDNDTTFSKSVKLSVLVAEGVKVVNLENLTPLNDNVIPRGTQIDIVAKTMIGSDEYFISSYAKNKGMASGIRSNLLGVPAVPPIQEKPEWLKNLKDITDITMWTRSQTPVLQLENGDVTRHLSINAPVRITHATNIVGKNLLVLENSTEAIETIYLSDTEIKEPESDLKERVIKLEGLVQSITDFLSLIFKNFRK